MIVRVMLLMLAAGSLHAQITFERLLRASQEPQNWLTYSGSNTGQRYSPLNQITPENVKLLEKKWSVESPTTEKHQATPLVVDGVMYTIQSPNDVIALNAATGEKLWSYSHKPDPAAKNCCGKLSRGLAILGNRLFLAAFDSRMIAIDTKTGTELWNTPVADPKQGYAFTHAPLIIKDKVIAGTAGGEFGVRGFIAAWDVNTGKEVWRFNTVPGPGEAGRDSWSGDSWEHGGAPIWVTGSYDPDLNLTYWGTGNPGPDWNGNGRLGDNLYSCSLIAIDADTGKLKWHYQFSPHNEFDWDSTQVPVLADMDWKGRARKVVMLANRSGVFYVLDRVTGEFLLGKPFVKVNWVTDFDAKGKPIRTPNTDPTPEGVLIYPGNQGGTNWYNPSYSPRTGLFYIPVWENSSSIYWKNEPATVFEEGKTFSGEFPKRTNTGEDQYSAVRAIDPQTGERKWEYRLTANATEAGILTTASDLLFTGGKNGDFHAIDARDGKELWKLNLGRASITAGPMTYSINGKQYVTIQAGRVLTTFALP